VVASDSAIAERAVTRAAAKPAIADVAKPAYLAADKVEFSVTASLSPAAMIARTAGGAGAPAVALVAD
jgi:hypothetical protein